MRCSEIKRTTAETDIALKINLDGKGNAEVNTGVPFLDHMLDLLSIILVSMLTTVGISHIS